MQVVWTDAFVVGMVEVSETELTYLGMLSSFWNHQISQLSSDAVKCTWIPLYFVLNSLLIRA